VRTSCRSMEVRGMDLVWSSSLLGDVGWARCSRRWCIEVNAGIPCGVTALGDVMRVCSLFSSMPILVEGVNLL
jgi:hypothetical protein